jgi:hypothetical protein
MSLSAVCLLIFLGTFEATNSFDLNSHFSSPFDLEKIHLEIKNLNYPDLQGNMRSSGPVAIFRDITCLRLTDGSMIRMIKVSGPFHLDADGIRFLNRSIPPTYTQRILSFLHPRPKSYKFAEQGAAANP